MTYRTEFPDFPEADMPVLPVGFEDTSWANNSAPSFQNDEMRISVWIDFANPEQSEWSEDRASGGMKRFAVNLLDAELAPTNDMADLETDDWNEVLAFILAEAFAAECRDAFTDEEMAEIRRRNATPEYQGEPGPCATHDFADANMIMAAAFEVAFGREPQIEDLPDGTEPPDIALWNAAWTSAKARHLTEAPAPNPEALLRELREEVIDWQEALCGEREGLDDLCARIDTALGIERPVWPWIEAEA